MEIKIFNYNGQNFAEVISDKVIIKETQDALDLMANCDYRGARKVIIAKHNLAPGFFDLKTGIAGEILQKFSTYGVALAITGDFSEYKSKSLKDFVYECNKGGQILFVNSPEDAFKEFAKT